MLHLLPPLPLDHADAPIGSLGGDDGKSPVLLFRGVHGAEADDYLDGAGAEGCGGAGGRHGGGFHCFRGVALESDIDAGKSGASLLLYLGAGARLLVQ